MIKPNGLPLVELESESYPDGKRKTFRVTVGNSAMLVLLILLALSSELPLGKILRAVHFWKWIVP